MVFEICRKHLHDLEQQSNTKWWMFTTDADEFLWINRSAGAKTAKDVLQQLLSNYPDTLTILIPALTYGSSGQENYIQGKSLKKLFHHRFDVEKYKRAPSLPQDQHIQHRHLRMNHQDSMESKGYKNCYAGNVRLFKPYQVQPKVMTMVSAMAEYCGEERTYCITPHCHSISVDKHTSHLHDKDDSRVFHNRNDVQDYFAIAHYKVKSREEFYNRVCLSQWFDKYYFPEQTKSGYPGCCSPKSYFDSLENYTHLFDDRMDDFENDITSSELMTAIPAQCNTRLQKSPCPRHIMEITGQEGILAMEHWKNSLPVWEDNFAAPPLLVDQANDNSTVIPGIEDDHRRPLIFSAGFGTTGTHAIFQATCDIGLCSLHWALECCNRTIQSYPEHYLQFDSQYVPFAGWLAHERALKSFRVIGECISQDEFPCPTVNLAFNSLRYHVDSVISNKEIDVIHDAPYPDFAEYVLKSAEKIRGVKPIVLLTQRDPEKWAKSRTSKWQASNICRLDFTQEDGITPIGGNLYMCLKTAISKGFGESSIRDILISPVNNNNSGADRHSREEIIQALSAGFRTYQARMLNEAVYSIDLFEQNPKLLSSEIGQQIKNALLSQQYQTSTTTDETSLPLKLPIERHGRVIQPKRSCMADYETAMVTGRHCDKLVLFLHFHKGGGTSMINYLHKRGLRTDFRVNSDPARFDEFQDGDDMILAPWKNNLKLKSNVGTSIRTRASSTDFWWSLYQRGLDVVNLEYNFLMPKDYFNVTSVVRTITMLRNPWDRFRSTYEKELSTRCRKCRLCSNLTMTCYEDNNLGYWMSDYKGVLSEQRVDNWGGILHPNYYTRMLNGLGDVPDLELNKSHLETAKRVLDTFDNVLILEDTDESKMHKVRNFLGNDAIVNSDGTIKEGTLFPTKSNNLLKNDPLYKKVREIIDHYQDLFDKRNELDIELYEYARSISLS